MSQLHSFSVVSQCDTVQPCQNNANCVDLTDGSYLCECQSGYTGSNCEIGKKTINELSGIARDCDAPAIFFNVAKAWIKHKAAITAISIDHMQ